MHTSDSSTKSTLNQTLPVLSGWPVRDVLTNIRSFFLFRRLICVEMFGLFAGRKDRVPGSLPDTMKEAPWCSLEFDDGKVLTARGGSFAIGRAEGNDLVDVSAHHMSGNHCKLERASAGGEGGATTSWAPPTLTDTSSNGTFVSGDKVHRAARQLKWNDRVEVVKGNKVSSLCVLRTLPACCLWRAVEWTPLSISSKQCVRFFFRQPLPCTEDIGTFVFLNVNCCCTST